MNKIFSKYIMLIIALFFIYSCNTKELVDFSYNPNSPVTLDSFAPLKGGMATKVILSGENLGNDPSQIKVYFNNKKASVIGCDKGKVLVVTPRQPGDTCKISVVIGKDSLSYSNKFAYKTTTTVTTLVGKKGTTLFKSGSFSEATFAKPHYLSVDNEYNLFLVSWGGTNNGNISMINQQNKTVTELAACGPTNIPTTDITGNIVMIPTDEGDDYYLFDPDSQWAARKRKILHPTNEDLAKGQLDFTIEYKHSFAVCKLDSCVYTRSYEGQLIKFNPKTRKGQLVADNIMPRADGYLQFDPNHPEMLYLVYQDKSAIYTYNIRTKEHVLFAGTKGLRGWKDGKKEDALFNKPKQFVFDQDGNIIIADSGNSCIRKITPAGDVVTIIGIGGKAGYQDGNPEDALFNDPRGVCIDKDYNIYIADFGNNCVRKLAIQ
jgi:IPT/TIG domain./NHL repeat.